MLDFSGFAIIKISIKNLVCDGKISTFALLSKKGKLIHKEYPNWIVLKTKCKNGSRKRRNKTT